MKFPPPTSEQHITAKSLSRLGKTSIVTLIFCLLTTHSILAAEKHFRLATFSADVTPPLGHTLFTGGWKKAESILAPLEARGFVLLPPAAKPVVFCAIDWSEIRNDAHQRWREVLAKAAGTSPERVMICAIHQHDTPLADLAAQRILERYKSPHQVIDLDFHERSVQAVAKALRESLNSKQIVTHIGTGKAKVEKIASNRRYLLDDGTIKYNRGSACSIPAAQAASEGIIDPFLKTLSFWNEDQALCALSIYATHPMSYYQTQKVNPDFPGIARARRQGDDAAVFQVFANGAAGNVTAGKYNDGNHKNRAILADRLYQGMLKAWKNTKKQVLTSLDFRQEIVKFSPNQRQGLGRDYLIQVLSKEGDARRHGMAAIALSWLERAEREGGQGLINLPLFEFNKGQTQLLLLPAEIYVEYQLFAQQQRPDSFVMTAGYGQCAPGYIPLERHREEKDSNLHSWCWVAPGIEQPLKKAIADVLKKK